MQAFVRPARQHVTNVYGNAGTTNSWNGSPVHVLFVKRPGIGTTFQSGFTRALKEKSQIIPVGAVVEKGINGTRRQSLSITNGT